MSDKREQLIDIMQEAAKGETKEMLRRQIAALKAENETLREDNKVLQTEACRAWGLLKETAERALAERAGGAKVKALRWGDIRQDEDGFDVQDAYCSIGHYIASINGWFLLGQSGWEKAGTLYEAKAAAQADYERRILSALSDTEQAAPEDYHPSEDEFRRAADAKNLPDPTSDYVQGDDGFWVFWPTSNKGAYSANDLRKIADKLDSDNAAWQAQIEKGLGASGPDHVVTWIPSESTLEGILSGRLKVGEALKPDQQEARPSHCGGCGETNPDKRCIGCLADFGPIRPAEQAVTEAIIDKAVVEAIHALRVEQPGRAYDILKAAMEAARASSGGRT